VQYDNTISEVISNFECDCEFSAIQSYGSGHINDTYFLTNTLSSGSDYLLQRINHLVFKDVPQLTQNMCMVISHLKSKIIHSGHGDPETEVMTLIPAKDGKYYYKNIDGEYWRMSRFLAHTKSYDIVENEKQAFEGGKAFGKFQFMLSDLPAGLMHEVIPDFHNIEFRLKQLEIAVAQDACNRLRLVERELNIVKKYADSMRYFQLQAQLEALPKRVIHNDTKFNNVLLNSKDEAQCVIDLDTVMDGYIAYDFGDAIRTIINTTSEDQEDLSKIGLNMDLFDAYTKGYLQEASNFITDAEVSSLLKGVLLLPYMQAVRFLTDYINGDKYFKIKSENHNLQRTRAQLQLLHMLDANALSLQNTILQEMNFYRAKKHV
jgi:Ser/Thr protein kinase RdoA (MazF antagonist)